jgi:outer membrane immunogenic protein
MQSKSTAKRIALSLLAVAMAAGLGTGAARAQYAPPPPAFYTWNGGYVGLNVGIAGGADAISESGTANTFGFGFLTTSGSGTMTALGFTGGGVAGYNWQIGGWVLGVEFDASYVGLNGSQDLVAANFSSIGEHDSFNTSWLSTLRGRMGYAWGNWLFYLTAGAALGDHKYDGVIHAFGLAHPSGDVVKAGWSAGIGTEWMFAPGWMAKLEYLFADLGSETFSVNTYPKVSVTGHLTEDMIRLGLNYKLGW